MRIALEALYLGDNSPEVSFRLATRGAWHLGTAVGERRHIYDTLRETHGLSSKAVHANKVVENKKNRTLLGEAQDLCRRGILKRLDEDGEPKWNDIILGAGVEWAAESLE